MLRKGQTILDAFIDALSWDDAIQAILRWGAARESRYVCICNAHSVVTTTQDIEFKLAVNNADMATADGAPIAWAMRRLGYPTQERINGPDLMVKYLEAAERVGQKAFFYGSVDSTLEKLRGTLSSRFPKLAIAGMYSPPFRPLTHAEDEAIVSMINESGANVVFVGLGCPKQEKWMADHRGRIQAVMIGVGAAFDYHSGVLKRAPLWWQRNGLEWLYRLGSEPRRLFKRYLVTNTLFVVGFLRQLAMQQAPIKKAP
ncbi:N-acetylglucosaminyldiphosphoundecaprenol N-acetyl-beta-D-mannosaminyltransferase [Noviherbaspirillum humi]|uniref:N-acetylglucosaminyldiphosphoundecaprenol N-acetyl-beta-D-mannosaminyltransferase n=1 Tax=Noviherbaspirillum humi TaxID=1688639 RepID=A0A239H1X1_9BURK|nr:WecB/TagA/CpsF family glycosyltransferase [Noviherbaspirillum humi]SNS74254.1 N-acetylglucosaminyldiphosphoundecaprenol N-acetyl-beta-D-mannosaminyltransferase [Noviherbaspirillum humi]